MNRKNRPHAVSAVSLEFRLVPSAPETLQSDALVLFLFDNLAGSLPAALPRRSRIEQMIEALKESGEFKGKEQETAVLPTWDRLPWTKLLLAGLGDPRKFGSDKLLRAAATVSRKASKVGCAKLAVPLPIRAPSGPKLAEQARTVAEGITLGQYRFDQFKSSDSEPVRPVREVIVAAGNAEAGQLKQFMQAGRRIAASTNYARDIANLPGNVIDPQTLAEEALKLGRELKLRVRVWDKARLKKERFGGILAVGVGSKREPRFIQIEYRPRARRGKAKAQNPVALVGKAITFDSGGISIKPSDKMDEMKFDKCGGVAVLGAMRAIASLELPIPVVGLIASAENMPSSSSYRPGDIVKTYSGKTVEVLNTDAEGRIVLADALAYACTYKPQAIIDLATLTGACVVALGPFAAGLFSNNRRLENALRGAGEETGERVWPLPLWEDYHKKIESPVADIKNTGGREGGAITAACFLQKFVGNTPWAHLDIAGTAWTTEEKPHMPRGATGYGVRLLTELLRNWKPL